MMNVEENMATHSDEKTSATDEDMTPCGSNVGGEAGREDKVLTRPRRRCTRTSGRRPSRGTWLPGCKFRRGGSGR